MRILTLVKRVPATGGRINLAPDGRSVDTAYLGFVVSPHEECAVEEAVRAAGYPTVEIDPEGYRRGRLNLRVVPDAG